MVQLAYTQCAFIRFPNRDSECSRDSRERRNFAIGNNGHGEGDSEIFEATAGRIFQRWTARHVVRAGQRGGGVLGKLFNVDVVWFDGEFDSVKQRAAVENIAAQKWDFVAIQPNGIGVLTAPVKKMIDAGVPVINMDALIAPLDTIDVHTFIAPNNDFMGAAVAQALVDAIGGKGNVVMTQAQLGLTGTQGRGGFSFCDVPVSRDQDPGRTACRFRRHQGSPHLGSAPEQVPQD